MKYENLIKKKKKKKKKKRKKVAFIFTILSIVTNVIYITKFHTSQYHCIHICNLIIKLIKTLPINFS